MSDLNDTKSILNVLDYTKANKAWFDSHNLVAGYHSVSLNGQHFRGQRDPARRLEKLGVDLTGKTVLDVGCSNGGILHTLAPQIRLGVGIDYNPKCINAANILKASSQYTNIHYYVFDLDREDISLIPNFLMGQQVDVCFFLNIALWVERWKAVFEFCADLSDLMVFESHGDERQQQEQIEFVKEIFEDVTLKSSESDDDPTYAKRKLYCCQGRRKRKSINPAPASNQKIQGPSLFQSHSEEAVRTTYEAAFPGENASSVTFHPNTHESIVAEVNEEFIVKFPRPSRGVSGIAAEKAITGMIRERVELPIPDLEIHNTPVPLARYKKLPGAMFSRKHYDAMSDLSKDQLAEQLSNFLFQLHSIPTAEISGHIPLSPSWVISCDQIEEFLGSNTDHVISSLVTEVVKNQRALQVPDANLVFGHFDLHGSNVLVDDRHQSVTGIIDFGNCKIGDLHQDISVMNLSSPDLTYRMITTYEKLSGRRINSLLVDHYTTVFYLNLLASHKRKHDTKAFDYWLERLHRWYDLLVARKAAQRLNGREPVSKIHAKWREWMAGQVIAGVRRPEIQNVLREQGYSDLDIGAELLLIEDHPFIKAGQKSHHLLQKRNWLLQTADALGRLDRHYAGEIEVRQVPDFQTFVEQYYSKMRPVVLKGGVDHWPALKLWTPEYFREKVGLAEVEIQHGRDSDPDYERNARAHKKRVLMSDFVDMVTQGGATNDYYMTAGNTQKSLEGIEALFQDIGDFYQGYRKPETWYRQNLLWFGPKGTFTPLHHDLTNNMLVQLYGRKKVTIYPAFQVPYMYNDKGVFSAINIRKLESRNYPLFKKAMGMEVVLEPGDAIFLPISSWHMVESLDNSISITFTDFNIKNRLYHDFPRERQK
ncbi:cupin-like domain-containing protein [Marinobacter sp. NFXS9]|uniref:cupin-like domain-containing protein n=1 Tax=Marinobacter sp. NFXS9 TaxID=2818433 RepID=UPI0032DE7D1C